MPLVAIIVRNHYLEFLWFLSVHIARAWARLFNFVRYSCTVYKTSLHTSLRRYEYGSKCGDTMGCCNGKGSTGMFAVACSRTRVHIADACVLLVIPKSLAAYCFSW